VRESQEICSTLDLRFFIHDLPTYIAESDLRKRSQPADAWRLRDDLLRLKADNEAALAFLNKWGRWIPFRNYVDVAENRCFAASRPTCPHVTCRNLVSQSVCISPDGELSFIRVPVFRDAYRCLPSGDTHDDDNGLAAAIEIQDLCTA
jgi:hypothetical protein